VSPVAEMFNKLHVKIWR